MPSINTAPTARMQFQHGPAFKSPPAQKPEKAEDSPRPSSAPAPETRETSDPTRAKGVLRLLAEGHFNGNGVAAIRLRMNFHAELQEMDAAAQTQSTLAAAKTLHADMAETLAETGKELNETLVEPVNTLFSQFDQAVGDSLNDEAAAGSEIHTAVTDALSDLRKGLADLVEAGDAPAPSDSSVTGETAGATANAPVAVEETGDTTADATTPQPIVSRLIDEVDHLTLAFENAVSSISQLSSIEDIEPPNGNGVAFEKFVEQYRAQFASGVDQSDELPGVDEQV